MRWPHWTFTRADEPQPGDTEGQRPLFTRISNGHASWQSGTATRVTVSGVPASLRDMLAHQAGCGVFVRLWNPDGEVVTRRSRHVGSDQGVWQCAAAESLEVADMTGGIEQWGRRAIDEELGPIPAVIQPAGLDLVWNEGLYIRWWAYAHTTADSATIIAEAARAKDSWEHDQLAVVTANQLRAMRETHIWLNDHR